ncbi:MAG: RNA polymerase sigma factor [Paracoccaceae bacterium]
MKRIEKALEGYLVAAAKSGDHRALDQLVELRAARLRAHAVRLLGEVEGARDVMQDSWIEIMRSLGGLRDGGAFLPWSLRIVTRQVARLISRRQRDRRLAGEYAVTHTGEVAEAGPRAVDAARVRHAITRLPAAQHATVALFYLEDMNVAEVALAMGVPVGTVKTRLMHARAKLRAELERK